MTEVINKIIGLLDSLAESTGRLVAWLVLALALLTLAVAIPRYLLSSEWFLDLNLFSLDWESIRSSYSSSVNAMNDSIQYLHAIIFMLGLSYALKTNDHVRIDILYRKASERRQAWINIIGVLLLFYPSFIFILIMSWDYVLNAWGIMEGSSRPGGLPLIWLLKTLLLVMPVLMILQGSALLLRNIQILRGTQAAQADNTNEVM